MGQRFLERTVQLAIGAYASCPVRKGAGLWVSGAFARKCAKPVQEPSLPEAVSVDRKAGRTVEAVAEHERARAVCGDLPERAAPARAEQAVRVVLERIEAAVGSEREVADQKSPLLCRVALLFWRRPSG